MKSKIMVTFDKFPAIAAKVPAAAGDIVQKAAEDIEAHAKAAMQGPKSGRMYGDHQASAKGEAPAIEYGALANSIQTIPVSQTEAIVAVGAEYGVILEFGGVHVSERPFMVPAAEAIRPGFVAAMEKLGEKLA